MTLALMTAVPLATALLLVMLGSRVGRSGSAIVGAGALVIAFGAASAVGQAFAAGTASVVAELGPWLPIRGAAIAFVVDPRNVSLVLATAGIGAGVGIYAAVRLWRDPAAVRFFIALDLLVAALLIVLMARDLVLLLAGWEGIGVAAYLLIAQERHRPEASVGAARAFVLARAGDAALLIAALGMLALFQTVDLDQINGRLAASAAARPIEGLRATSLLVVLAALVRAGQVPFQAWLPGRSQTHAASLAAIHGLATIGGAFLLIRLTAVLDPGALLAAAAVGIVSAIVGMAAAIADRRTPYERWFTVAQLGIVTAACGLGSPAVGLIVVGSSIVRVSAAAIADRWPRPARLFGAVGILAAAVVLADGSPTAPLLAGVMAVGALAGGDAVLELVGDRVRLIGPAVRLGDVVRGAFAAVEGWIVRPLQIAATIIEQGAEQSIATIEDALARATWWASAAVQRFHRSSLWAHEALLLAAALVIVLYWIVR